MNIKLIALAGLVTATLVTAAAAQDAQPPAGVIGREDMAWETLPRTEDFLSAYPRTAREGEYNGRSAVRCRVAESRRLVDCVVLGETPEGLGFGKAALKLTSKFKAAPATKSGQPTVGRKVDVLLNWIIA